jgi:hypothetical protein
MAAFMERNKLQAVAVVNRFMEELIKTPMG